MIDVNKMREQFEAAVIARFKESGFLEVEIRVECLGRSGDGYQDGSVDAYWHFWKASREAVAVELPKHSGYAEYGYGDDYENGRDVMRDECREAIEAQGLKVKP